MNKWTLDSYIEYNEALRAAEEKFQKERDRRYAEVNAEKEKEVKTKEAADVTALQLAREIQTYKDEKANELRTQINREREDYARKTDLISSNEKYEATLKPVLEYIASKRGQSEGVGISARFFVATVTLIVVIAMGIIAFLTFYKGG